MKKKLLTIAMAFCLIATMMPIYTGVAFALEGNSGDIQILGESYDLCINNAGYLTTTTDDTGTTTLKQVGNNDNWNIKIAKGTEEHTYEITLSGAAIKSSESETCGIIVFDQYNSANKVTITLVGTNTIETSGSAISMFCNVEINGNGTLIATGNGNTNMQHGIKAVALAITGNATVEATGGEHGDGILASSLTVSGKKVTATGGSNGNGIFCDTGDIIISGTTTSVSAIGGNSGILNYTGAVEITDKANVTASGSSSHGIISYSNVTISGATVMATGKTQGISANGNSMQITGGAFVNATGTEQVGLNAGDLSIGGTTTSVTAIGGTNAMTSVPSFGNYAATTRTSANIDGSNATSKETLTTMSGIKYIAILIGDQVAPAPSTPSPSRPSSPTINISGGQADAAGGTAVFDPATKALTINPAAGFTVKEVLVNGQSKGAVTSLADVSVYDKVEVVFEKIPEKTPEQIQAEKDAKIKAGVKATTINLSAKARAKGIKLTWEKSKGYKVNKYLIYRSVNGGKYKLYKTTTSTSFTNSKVTEGKVYRFKVKGVRTVGDDKVYTETSKVVRVRVK